jgi:hypothetical protein
MVASGAACNYYIIFIFYRRCIWVEQFGKRWRQMRKKSFLLMPVSARKARGGSGPKWNVIFGWPSSVTETELSIVKLFVG